MGLYKRNKIWWFKIICKGKKIQESTNTENKKLAERIYAKVLFDVEEYTPDDFEIIRLIETLRNETKLIGVKARKLGLPENL